MQRQERAGALRALAGRPACEAPGPDQREIRIRARATHCACVKELGRALSGAPGGELACARQCGVRQGGCEAWNRENYARAPMHVCAGTPGYASGAHRLLKRACTS